MNTKMSRNTGSSRAVEMLRDDHHRLLALFQDFEDAELVSDQRRIAERTISELTAYTLVEQMIFYPALRSASGEETLTDEAVEKHHLFWVLLRELKALRPGERHFNAKFAVLSENVRLHIEEEETQLIPMAERSGIDMMRLGSAMVELREILQRVGGRGRRN